MSPILVLVELYSFLCVCRITKILKKARLFVNARKVKMKLDRVLHTREKTSKCNINANKINLSAFQKMMGK